MHNLSSFLNKTVESWIDDSIFFFFILCDWKYQLKRRLSSIHIYHILTYLCLGVCERDREREFISQMPRLYYFFTSLWKYFSISHFFSPVWRTCITQQLLNKKECFFCISPITRVNDLKGRQILREYFQSTAAHRKT